MVIFKSKTKLFPFKILQTGVKPIKTTKHNEANKRFIYPNKEIIRVIIFSAINLLSIKKKRVLSLYVRSTVNQRNYVIFMSYEGLFVRRNYAKLRKKIVIA